MEASHIGIKSGVSLTKRRCVEVFQKGIFKCWNVFEVPGECRSVEEKRESNTEVFGVVAEWYSDVRVLLNAYGGLPESC